MAWINGQWVDEDELQGMLYQNPLASLGRSAFTGPLSTLTQQATGVGGMLKAQHLSNQFDNSALSQIRREATPQSTLTGEQARIRNLIETLGDPSSEVSDDPTATPRVDPNIITGPRNDPFAQNIDMSRWDMLPDPTSAGTHSVMPNVEVNQPITTGLIPAGGGGFLKDWVDKIDDARTIGGGKVGVNKQGVTFTVPTGLRSVVTGGPTVDAPPPDLIAAKKQADEQAMLARAAQSFPGAEPDYSQMAQDWGDPTMMLEPTDPTGGAIPDDYMATVLSNANMDNLYAGLGTGWDQTDASGIYGTATYVGDAAKTGGASGSWTSAASAGWPRTTAAQINAAMRQSDASAIDLPSAIDLGLHMIPTDPTSEKPIGTDYDVGAGLGRYLDDPSRIGDIATDIANTVRSGVTWGPDDIKDLDLSAHDQRVVNSLIGHVDLGDMGEYSYGNTSPTTSVTDLPGMGFAPGVTIEEQSTFQPNTYAFDPTKDHIEQPDEGIQVAPTHTLGSKWKDEVVDAITVPTKTTLSWVDTPTPTKTKRTKAVTRQEDNRIRQEAKKAADQQRKDDLAAQKRAEDAQRTYDRLKAAAADQAAQAAANAQAQAIQAQLAYAAMKLQLMQGRDRGEPSPREIERAMEKATQVDTFGQMTRDAADRASVGIDASGKYSGGPS